MVGGQTFNLSYDAKNRLVSVSGAVTASFVHNSDGNRVKSTINGITTTFVGAHYEVTGSQITKYYFAGAQRVAMRTRSTLHYLLGDHLGSASLVTDANGQVISEMRYKAWGEVRSATGNLASKAGVALQYNNRPLA